MNYTNIELINVKTVNTGCIVANMTINFLEDHLEIKGFRIMRKGDKAWVEPPSLKNQKMQQWCKIVIITDKNEWKKFEQTIIEKYEDKNPIMSDNSSIKEDEIPI